MEDIKILKKEDKDFPQKLFLLEDCPNIIYTLGDTKILNDFSIGVVGSRNCSSYGIDMTEIFTKELVMKNICIISGLALGIDSSAHKTCLESKGKTIAVLGGGFNRLYPKENKKLFEEIIENGGAVISEYAPDVYPLQMNFVKRNRIVAALSDGLLVVEAREKSGALITANIAKKLKKKLFVVPANLDSIKSKGSNMLINNGAKCVTCAKDILNEFQEMKFKNKKTKKENIKIPEEYIEIYNSLLKSSKTSDEISREIKMPISQINYKLTMMEIEGYIAQMSDQRWKIRRP